MILKNIFEILFFYYNEVFKIKKKNNNKQTKACSCVRFKYYDATLI